MKHIFDTAYGSYRNDNYRWCQACLEWIKDGEQEECTGIKDSPCHVCGTIVSS
jgi:hypothetical protein